MHSYYSLHYLFDIFLSIVFFLFLAIASVLVFSFYQFKKKIYLIRWAKLINDKITAAIVYGDELQTEKDNFLKFNNNSSFRKLFLEKLVESESKFSGIAQGEISKLFTYHNLQEEAINKLNQKKTYLIATGIHELTVMRVTEFLPKIKSFLTHRSSLVYQEVQYAMVSFNGFEGFHFLDTTTNKISEWQQLRLLRSINIIPPDGEASIQNWLESKNNSVTQFTLRLISKFQILLFYPNILNLINHSSVEVSVQAIKTLQALENPSTITDLITVFKNQTDEVQIEILRILKISKDQTCVDFLKEQLLKHSSTKLRIYCAEALFLLGHDLYLQSLTFEKSSNEKLVKIIKHAIQEKLC
jgi:hypothetical protein